MAEFDPNIVRAVAIELKDRVQDLYLTLLPIVSQTNAWTVHCQNTILPDPFAVKVQIDAYQALKIMALELRTWTALLQAAQPDDTIEYTAPCEGMGSGLFDGSTNFDGSTIFDGGN